MSGFSLTPLAEWQDDLVQRLSHGVRLKPDTDRTLQKEAAVVPRQPRMDYEGAWHHVMNRGAAHRDIYRDGTDRLTFLDCLSNASHQAHVEIHGYCLMTNHFHLLVRSQDGRLSDFMRMLSGRYSRRFNQRWSSDGPIFRGRCHSIEISSDAQLVATSRYIHLNPIDAGLLRQPAAWTWSSAAAYLGEVVPPAWLLTNDILDMFAGSAPGIGYASFLQDGVDAKTAQFYNELQWDLAVNGVWL